MSMVEQERAKQREYWRVRKAEQRRRLPKAQPPAEPTEKFISLVFAESEFRLQREYKMWRHPDMITHAYRASLLKFAADVWAAIVVIEKMHGTGNASPTRIANWLYDRDLSHGCTRRSLRTMVYRAFEKIKRLESEPYLYDRREVVWPPFSIDSALERQGTRTDFSVPNNLSNGRIYAK